MMLPSVSFGKTLAAKGGYLDNGVSKICKIYELSPIKDKNYFKHVISDNDWKGNYHLKMASENFLECYLGDETFVAENSAGKCLGYINISEGKKFNGWHEINFLETCPSYANKNQNRTVKYIGETLLSFAVLKSKNSHDDYITVPSAARRAWSFYKKKCGFHSCGDTFKTLFMDNFEYDKLLDQNTRHTGVKLECVA
ncbi:GNAT family N-acetyltransferase [bacterium]|nr:GNAT family N-acetyltransferase [bacterium]